MLRELAVYNKFWVSSRAKFVEIHPLPFAFRRHPLWGQAIDHPIQSVS